MAVYINSVFVQGFRGIQELQMTRLNHVNLIVGDNNCGKTSVLEAIQLLRNPSDLTNFMRVARMRDVVPMTGASSIYENFMNLFPKNNGEKKLWLSAMLGKEYVEYSVSGVLSRILLDEKTKFEILKPKGWSDIKPLPDECEAFIGVMDYHTPDVTGEQDIRHFEYSRVGGMELKKKEFMKMIYLSPIDHVKGNIINHIIRNAEYKEICLKIIQLFDPDIMDLLIMKNEQSDRFVEYIRHKELGNMPISTYGDGIKKVLVLANSVAQAAGGGLMIDEIDTAIHAKYYHEIFQFLIKACIQYQVQLFITTHSMEAVDALLKTQKYESGTGEEIVTVYTLKRGGQKTAVRTLTGREVYENREAFDFEVRL